MITRKAQIEIAQWVDEFPAVGVLGARQIGKTTLTEAIATSISWEGFVIENLLSCLPIGVTPLFYRTAAGAEIDLVIERNAQPKYAIEIKRSLAPSLSKGFYLGCEDIGATNRFLVYPGNERYPIFKDVTAISLTAMMQELHGL